MIDQSKNVETKSDDVSVPDMISGVRARSKKDLSDYRVRIDRFVIDSGLDDCSRLEALYTRGLDSSGDIVILKEKSFTDKDQMIVVVFYMEKRIPDGFDQPTTASS